jgi:ParB-like chromosome segregation protein Spo0J
MELVSTRHIKRIPGMQTALIQKDVVKVRDFAKKRGYCNPVVLSDHGGSMTLLSGAATFEVCLEEKETKIPAVIVQTDGEADDLMFVLQSAELSETFSAVAAGAAIVRLIDSHAVPRKHIIEALGKSPAWLNKMESLSRRLNSEVQQLVAEGQVAARSAQEIARLPSDVQMAFAISVGNDYLSKDNIAYLVSRYLNEDASPEERDRIINTPKLALPNEHKSRRRMGKDHSISARLSRAIAGCLDGNAYLHKLLTGMDISEAAVRMTDIEALVDGMAVLHMLLMSVFYPGKNKEGGDAYDRP